MRKIKTKIITSFLSLLIVAATLFTPFSAFARTTGDPTNQLDGKLSTIYQGDVGDCGAISAIQALDNSRFGRSLFRRMISVNNDYSYTLNFGAGRQTVSEEDVDDAYVTGDLDARVVEAGLQKAMNIYNGCFACDVFVQFTGFRKNTVYGATNKTNIMNTMASRCASGNGITAACDFTKADESKGIIGNGEHSYSIKSVTPSTVVVINPWDTSKYISMSRSQFEDSIRYMTYVDETTKQVVVFWN
ncbi:MULTISPECIES: TrbC/VirB2 family protein [Clostridium]|uniref:TrbC/VirB2 family protein n=1 Tax=Clostridium TaxID=1485 RepID=UPI000825D81C|nr:MULTISPECIES: TrbC/VirB2 family protein [Clostridium]PJI10499.1 hypothetical protein CUB90_00450 [Clostridium sp. CT7]